MYNLQDITRKVILGFAKSDPLVTAVYNGTNPETNQTVAYYFVIKGPHNEKLSSRITDLDIFIANEIGYYCDLLEWPSVSNPQDYSFLGTCIWKRKYLPR